MIEDTRHIHQRQYDNGLVLLGEPMPWLESVAFCLLLPAGCSTDPEPALGLSNFCCEMVQRGSGQLTSREFVEALDALGCGTELRRIHIAHELRRGDAS